MTQATSKPLTLAEFLQQPETKPPQEYIEGKVIQKPVPQGKHSIIQGELFSIVNQTIKPQRIGRAFPELRCTFGDRSIVPDLVVFTWNRIPRDENGEISNTFNLAPDWTIEILSPKQNQTQVTKNILHCLQHGTAISWLIDPSEKTIFVYRRRQEITVFDRPEMILPPPEFASQLHLTVNDLFAWLLDSRVGNAHPT